MVLLFVSRVRISINASRLAEIWAGGLRIVAA